MRNLSTDDENEILELTWKNKKIDDDKPIQVGQNILQLAKLLLCKFVYFLQSHLEPGTFLLTYSDTDSIGIAFSDTDLDRFNKADNLEETIGSIFDPLVRPDMKKSWQEKYTDWFVVNQTVENQLKPGLLKCKLII